MTIRFFFASFIFMKFNRETKENQDIFFFLSKVVRDQKGNWPIWSGFLGENDEGHTCPRCQWPGLLA